jgi:hypothetical protein
MVMAFCGRDLLYVNEDPKKEPAADPSTLLLLKPAPDDVPFTALTSSSEVLLKCVKKIRLGVLFGISPAAFSNLLL